MKSVYHLFLTTCVLLLMACSSDEELALVDNSQTCHTTTLHLDGCIQHFDAQTRATTSEWEDGTKLYIQFQTANKKVNGVATYKEDTEEWEVNYYGSIIRGEATHCEVYYFERPTDGDMNMVNLNQYTAVYADTIASYLFQNGIVTLKTTLKPITGRIRFRGKAGYTFTISGLNWYSGYDITADTLSSQDGSLALTVENDGYTPYVYATFANKTERLIHVSADEEPYVFVKNFDETILSIGKGGFIDVPTMESRNGWSMITEPDPLGLCPGKRHPHMIDMGDGVMWACCNVGASSPIEYGDYYAWGETNPKTSDYDWDDYKWCNGTENGITKYSISSSDGIEDNKTQLELIDDAARVSLGVPWRMPTVDEFSFLCNSCKWTKTTINNINGYKVTATNGNVLFLPAGGMHYAGTSFFKPGDSGWYWSSSLGSKSTGAAGFYFSNYRGIETSDDMAKRCHGLSIRPVIGAYLNVFPSFIINPSYNAFSESFIIETDQTYTITTSASWFTAKASPDQKEVTLTVTENSKAAMRSGTITFTGGGLTRIVYITQDGNPASESLGTCPNDNHPHKVDMGNGVMWACCNVGASSPIDYGNYYAWGETTPKTDYSWKTYKWCNGTENSLTRYCTNSSYGKVDNYKTLRSYDDAAWVNWGDSWRMPIIDELSDLNSKCRWIWTTIKNVNGYHVIASNGNTIFLPAAGYFGYFTPETGNYGYYWSSSLHNDDSRNSDRLGFSISDRSTFYESRYIGNSVRPVTE